MTDHITAAELRELGQYWLRMDWPKMGEKCDRAAAALDALTEEVATLTSIREAQASAINLYRARIAELEEDCRGWSVLLSTTVADAELGALVRRWREHPERRVAEAFVDTLNTEWLTGEVDYLDRYAASREAEQGVEGPSGFRYRVRDDGVLEVKSLSVIAKWFRADSVTVEDIPTVAALIERHGGAS